MKWIRNEIDSTIIVYNPKMVKKSLTGRNCWTISGTIAAVKNGSYFSRKLTSTVPACWISMSFSRWWTFWRENPRRKWTKWEAGPTSWRSISCAREKSIAAFDAWIYSTNWPTDYFELQNKSRNVRALVFFFLLLISSKKRIKSKPVPSKTRLYTNTPYKNFAEGSKSKSKTLFHAPDQRLILF